MKTPSILTTLSIALLTSCTYDTPTSYNAPTSPIQKSKSAHPLPSNRNLRPTVKFPARIAIARVETNTYNSNMRLIEDRSFEKPEQLATIASLPNLRGVTEIDPGLLAGGDVTYPALRQAARRLGCNMLAVYRFNTSQQSGNGSTLLTVATLGAAPTNAHTTSTSVTLTLFDASNGYIYGTQRETAQTKSLSTSWGNHESQQRNQNKTEAKAYDKLIKNLPTFWNTVTRK